MTMRIDLGADLGEGYGAWRIGNDDALIGLLSSVNVACGYHAGDAEIMASTVAGAIRAGADIGAHVGLPDLIGFGRRRMRIDGASFASHVLYQLGGLHAITVAAGRRISHVSFHGALGDMMAEDASLASTLIRSVSRFDKDLIVTTSPGTCTMEAARRVGLRTIGIFAADRAYTADGHLLARGREGALIRSPTEVAHRVLRLLDDGNIETVDGRSIRMPARTIMIHSDTSNAVDIAAAIREAVHSAGGEIVPLSQVAGH